MSDAESLWDKLKSAKDSKSLLKKHLTQERFDKLKGLRTQFGGTLSDCIRPGALNPYRNVGVFLDPSVGVNASDPDAYSVFAALLEPVILDYHDVDKLYHPQCNFGDVDNLGFSDLDPSGDMIVSTRVRVARSHEGYGFLPVVTKQDRLNMETATVEALGNLKGELAGKYYPLSEMEKATETKLIQEHYLFRDDNSRLEAAGGYDDWPNGRGIYFNETKTFLVWVNEEDHLRFISMQKGGDLAGVYTRLVNALKTVSLTFAHDDKLGYLTFCPTNLGTTLRASVHIKIPKLLARTEKFKTICDKYMLQARGIDGEQTGSVEGVCDISNRRRLGLSEIDAIQEMRGGVEEIIALERSL